MPLLTPRRTRRPRPLRFVLAALPVAALGALAAACSSSSGGSSSDFVSQYCDLMSPCCAKAGLPADGAGCRAFLGYAIGSSAYDAAKGDACLREMRAAQSRADFCDGSTSYAPSCNGVFQSTSSGTKKPGEPCDTDADCAVSSAGKVRCASNYGTGGAKISVCQLQVTGKEGDTPCGGTVDGNVTSYGGSSSATEAPPAQVFMCDVKDGVYCKSSFTTGAPPPVCTRIQDVGSPCDTTGSSTYACVKTAYCDFTSKTCKTKAAVGEPCSGSITCAAGGYCDTSGASATCIAQLGEGAGCTSSSQCLSNNCNNKKCAKASSSNLGLAFLCSSTTK